MKHLYIIFYSFAFFITHSLFSCQCPIIEWTVNEVNKNDVIFRGKIKNVILHQNNYTVAEMEVINLFKGNALKLYKVLFPENDGCSIPVNVGEEWLIYSQQKQINSCIINWCGLSRKKFQNDAEDFFIATHIITYDEEINKLKENFQEIQFDSNRNNNMEFHKNIIPEKIELYLYMALSLIGFLILLYIVKNYLK